MILTLTTSTYDSASMRSCGKKIYIKHDQQYVFEPEQIQTYIMCYAPVSKHVNPQEQSF